VTFSPPLQLGAVLTVQRGTRVQTHVLEPGTANVALPGDQFVQMRDGVSCISLQIAGVDGLSPSPHTSARLTSRYARPVPPPDQTPDEKRVICQALRSLYLAHAGTLPRGVQVRVSDIDDLLRVYMNRPCILTDEVHADTCSLASVPDNAAALDGLLMMPRAKAATCFESLKQTMQGDVHCVEFDDVLPRTATGWQFSRQGDLLFGLRLEPAIDTDDLVLVFNRDTKFQSVRVRVRGGVVQLSRPLMLFWTNFSPPVDVQLPGFESYELTGTFGTLSGILRTLLTASDRHRTANDDGYRPVKVDLLWENCALLYTSGLVGVQCR
jgi:hypothetical protein